MKRFAYSLLAVAVMAAALTITGCDGNDEEVNLQVVTVEDIAADPATGRDPNTGQPTGTTNKFTFYSLRESKVILTHTAASRADSATNKWDIAFRGASIIVNGNGYGGGQGGAQVLSSAFESVAEAPSSGYTLGNMGLDISSPTPWGTYNSATMTVFPIENKTLLIRTGDGNGYAKVKILSYYKGAPEVPNPFSDQDRYYTFEYVLQTDGRKFE